MSAEVSSDEDHKKSKDTEVLIIKALANSKVNKIIVYSTWLWNVSTYVWDPTAERVACIQGGVVLFGRDVSTIPCFRSSFLYGIGSGVVSGLSYFMLTSKPRMSTHVGFGSFFCITMSYWFYCRYQWSQKKFGVGQLQGVIKRPPVFEASTAGETAK